MSTLNMKFTTVSEDTVHVNYYSFEFSKKCPETATWEKLCDSVNQTIKTLSTDFLWHKEDLKVYLPITNQEKGIPIHLKSTTCFGDNIEDEWYIVYLIFKISTKFEDLIIQMTDNDGDFLLIEAANYLPPWANPESTENRVFIYNGHIHIIPPTLVDMSTNLTTNEALKIIAQLPEQTRVSKEIEEAVLTRISKYPHKMYENFHNAVVKVPVDLAALLILNPRFISAIVDSYCNHDMFDIKYCQNIEYKDPIYVKVKFTKCLYAMLLHSKPIRTKSYKGPESDKKSILGFKLTCGLNILMKRLTKDIFSTKEFTRFLNNLMANGYFRENIKDSKEYNTLLEKAKQYFLDRECPINTHVCREITEVMASSDYQNVKDSLKTYNFTAEDLSDDSDEWLNIDSNQLNELLNTHYDNKIHFEKDDSITPQGITNKLTDFLKQTSDYEGIDTRESIELDSQSIEFDSNDFVNCVQKMLNILAPNSNDYIDSEMESDNTDDGDEVIEELASHANFNPSNIKDSKEVMYNITQSLKEEGLSGPASNLLKTIGINKTEILLDSDDD